MRRFLLCQVLLVAVFLLGSAVEGRTLRRPRNVAAAAQPTLPSPASDATQSTTKQVAAAQAKPTIETTASTAATASTTANRPTSTQNTTRSLYEELMSTSNFPSFESSYETSSEFMKFDNLKMKVNSDELLSSDESLMKKFAKDESEFIHNVTREEHRTIDKDFFDEESVKYSSTRMNTTKPQESVTTAMPTTAKKGKYLELMPPSRGENINDTIPNAAEVWALAGMRGVESRRDFEADESGSGIEVDGTWSNNTAKNLLDWSEISRMKNDSMMQATSTEENQKSLEAIETTAQTDLSGADDPATSENKGVDVFVASQHVTTQKPIGDHEPPKQDQSSSNVEIFSKSLDESEESAFELIDPSKKKGAKTKESLKVDKAEKFSELTLTTELPELEASTELLDTTTTEGYETTTSIIDSFTLISDDNEVDEIFKRTITEQPPLTTEQPAGSFSTTRSALTTEMTMETTTELPRTQPSENPEAKSRNNKSTKSISVPTTSTTMESSTEELMATSDDSKSVASTMLPKSTTSYRNLTTLQQTDPMPSTSGSTVEIFDDEKFRYSTLLPDTTTTAPQPEIFAKGNEEVTTKSVNELNQESLNGNESGSSNLGIISAAVSVVVLLVIAAAAYFIMKRRNSLKFNQRCRPVGLDAYSLDNVSVYNSVRRKANALRMSKRSYGNSAFEDPSLQSNVLDYQSLQDFAKNKLSIQNEFKDIPQVSVRVDEMPENCQDKNRYANVVPLPESRVLLQRLNDDEKTEYINANYVKGPSDTSNYYIATQAPLDNTVADFWRMIWEQNSKVIVMATNLTENGVERCAEYIPASVVLDNSQSHGDFQVTLKSREVKGKYAVSQIHLKNMKTNTWREIMHLWCSWPENGCPTDESSVISLLLEARGYLRNALPEHMNENSNGNGELNNNMSENEKISTLDKTKSLQRVQGPLTVHCSPGTGRTGTLIACDIILRMLETPPRRVDIPQIVYSVRKGRANAIRSKDQYEFIYSIANSYAMKLNAAPTEG